MLPTRTASNANVFANAQDVEYTEVELEDQALELRAIFERDPEFFYHEVLGDRPWEKQVETCTAVRDYRETSVYSCHASGKSWNAAAIALWFLFTYPGSIVLTTAPTFRQVKDILWRYMNAKFEKSRYRLGTRMNKTELNLAADWFAIGLSTNDPDKFQGYHAASGHLLVIADESAGIDELIFEAVDAVMTSEYCRLLMIGNPTSNSGRFFESVRTPGVKKIKITAWDTPNFKGMGLRTPEDLCRIYCPPDGATPAEKEAFRPPSLDLPEPTLLSPVWVHERIHKWGVQSPMYQSRVEAVFPDEGENTLIPLQWIENAMTQARREGEWVYEYTPEGRIRMRDGKPAQRFISPIADGEPNYGVDVARFGSDRTVVCYRRGKNVKWLKSYTKQRTTDTSGRILHLLKSEPGVRVFVDIIGLGAGVYDEVVTETNQQEHPDDQHQVFGVNVAMTASDEKWFNQRSEYYWRLREMFEKNEIALPDDEDLANELCQIQVTYPKGKIRIEEKEEIKKRLLRSPDLADALMLSFASPSYGSFEEQTEVHPPPDQRRERHRSQDAEPEELEEDEPTTAGMNARTF